MNGRPVDPDLERGLSEQELIDVSRQLIAFKDGVDIRAKVLRHTLSGGSCLIAIGTTVFYLRGVGTLHAGLPVPVTALSTLSPQSSKLLDNLRQLLDREHCQNLYCVLDLQIGETMAEIRKAMERICGNLGQKVIDSFGEWTNSTERREWVMGEQFKDLLFNERSLLPK